MAQPQRAQNTLLGRRRSARTPIGPGEQHAASFNPASNRSRAEIVVTPVTRHLFEASSIPPKAVASSKISSRILGVIDTFRIECLFFKRPRVCPTDEDDG